MASIAKAVIEKSRASASNIKKLLNLRPTFYTHQFALTAAAAAAAKTACGLLAKRTHTGLIES